MSEIQNSILHAAAKLLPRDSASPKSNLVNALTEISRNVKQNLDRDVCQLDIPQATEVANSLIEEGAVASATIIICVNLIATIQCHDEEWLKTELDLLGICFKLTPEPEQSLLLNFLETLDSEFDLKLLGIGYFRWLTLHAFMCGIVGLTHTYSQKIDLLEKSIESLKKARELAVGQRIDQISLQLSEDQLTLFELLGNADLSLSNDSLSNMEFCLEKFRRLEWRRSLFTDQTKQLLLVKLCRLKARQHANIVSSQSRLLSSEPALSQKTKTEGLEFFSEHALKAVSLRHESLKLIRHFLPGCDDWTEIAIELAKDLRMLACCVNTRRALWLRLIAENYLSDVAFHFQKTNEDQNKLQRCNLALAETKAILFTQHERGTLGDIKKTFESALKNAQKAKDSILEWESAASFGSFLIDYYDQTGFRKEAWQRIQRLMDLARRKLVEHVLKGQRVDADIVKLREKTKWFWELALRAAASSNNIEMIPEIIESQSTLWSLCPREIFKDDEYRWDALSQQLPSKKSAIVYIVLGNHHLHSFVVHKGVPVESDYSVMHTEWEQVRLAVDPWIASYHQFRTNGKVQDREIAATNLEKMLNKVYSLVWEKLDCRLKELGIKQVFLVRSRGISVLPFHAIERSDRTILLQDYTFTYVRSAREVCSPQIVNISDAKLLAVSNPTYDLKYATTEVRSIIKHFSCWRRKILNGYRVTKAAMKSWIASANIVHFACHGLFEIKAKGIYREQSGYLKLNDGKFLLNEIAQLDLKLRPIVFLSACETGRTDWRDIESTGIADYFIAAGASAVVATLWSVDDFATALLIKKTYELIANKSPLEDALQAAQLWLRELDRAEISNAVAEKYVRNSLPNVLRAETRELTMNTPFNNPYYWAAFFLTTGSKS